MTQVTRYSCWHQNFVPMGLSAPALGLYTCIKSRNKLYKIRLQRVFFFKLVANDWFMTRGLCWQQNFVPMGLSAPALGLYTCIKSRNKLYKIRLQRVFFFKLVANDWFMTRGLCWQQNFVAWGCLPLTCGYIHLLNHEKMCIKVRGWRHSFF